MYHIIDNESKEMVAATNEKDMAIVMLADYQHAYGREAYMELMHNDDLCSWCKERKAETACGLCVSCNGRNF